MDLISIDRKKLIGEYIVDFFCNKLALVIECDGYSHEIVEVYKKDVKKTKFLEGLGLTVLRFSDRQIMSDIDNVVRHIEDHIDQFKNKHTPLDSMAVAIKSAPLFRGEERI